MINNHIRLFILSKAGNTIQRTINLDRMTAVLKSDREMLVSCELLVLDRDSPPEFNKVHLVRWYDADINQFSECYYEPFEKAVACYRLLSSRDGCNDVKIETILLS